ncbi:MAG: glycosidase, partial [Calditrichaeota bacterium]
NGIEDARFVRFQEEDGSVWFYATYVAYDGRNLAQHLLRTQDFCRFHIQALQGPGVRNKGMALFPRKIAGQYAMLARPDNERLFLLFSPDLHFWKEGRLLLEPQEPWELVQLGNCGSPLETEAGWLVITHGVGPVRRYCLGAVLLDKHRPHRVLGRLRRPLLVPREEEREGYVPNVVYSCGGQVHGQWLYLPYAMSDSATSFVRIYLPHLLQAME